MQRDLLRGHAGSPTKHRADLEVRCSMSLIGPDRVPPLERALIAVGRMDGREVLHCAESAGIR